MTYYIPPDDIESDSDDDIEVPNDPVPDEE